MTKRSFGLDTTSLSTEAPLLDSGFYAGELVGAAIENKDHVSFFKIQEEKKWDKAAKEMVLTGDHTITGMLMYSVMLTSKLAIKKLQRDEPRIFGGMIFFRFDKKTFQMNDNPALGQLLKVFDLADTDFNGMVDFEMDDNIEVPTELANVPDIVTMLNSIEYYKALFTLIVQSINNLPCIAKVIKRPQWDNKEVQENSIDTGNSGSPFCGVIPYTEGSENDLEEA